MNQEEKSQEEEQKAPDAISLDDRLIEIRTILETNLSQVQKQNAFKDETIDRLQKVVYEYEKGFIRSIKEPIIKDLILFKDSFDKFQAMFAEASNVIVKEIEFLNDEVEDIFFAHGIEVIHNDSIVYDRNFQKVRKTVPTHDPSLDRNIIEITKNGYRIEDRILRKQEVTVYTFNDKTSEE